jgi:hypothetical protein
LDKSESSTVQIFEYQWTGKMLTSYIELLLNANRVNKAWSAFETYLKKQSKVTGELGEPLIKNFFDALYNTQQVEQAYVSFLIGSSLLLEKIIHPCLLIYPYFRSCLTMRSCYNCQL